MSDDNGKQAVMEAEKAVTQAAVMDETIQSRVNEETLVGFDILPMLLRVGEIIPPWWSRQRDYELGRYWMNCDHVASAFSMFIAKVSSIPVRVVAKNPSVKKHVIEADYYTSIIVDGSDFFAGWHKSLCPRLVLSWISKDNGMFMEVIGGGDDKAKPREGFLGLASLDSRRCQRTSNPVYPVIYHDTDGKPYKLHHTRVAFASSNPNDEANMNGVGHCALSRMIRTAQHLTDIGVYEQEKLGSRPHRQMIIGKEISGQEILKAFLIAEKQMDNQALSRYSKNVIIAKKNNAANFDIDTRDLASVPDGFDKQMSITLGMFLVALALNIPARWLWPASQSGATKADAMFQHVVGIGGGIGNLLMVFKAILGGTALSTVLGRAIPSHLTLEFDFQDDQQDRDQAEIRKIRAENRRERINDGEIDIRTARLHALDAGDLTQEEFNDLELADGRLADGQPVLNLFMSGDRDTQQMLALSVGDVLNVQANDMEFVLERIEERQRWLRAELMNPKRPASFMKAKQAFMALDALRELYQQPPQEQRPIEVMAPVEEEDGEDGKPGMEEAIEGEPVEE